LSSNSIKSKKLVIFDWDGTLFDSIATIQSSIVLAARENGAVVSDETARHIIGLGLTAAQEILFPGPKRVPEFYKKFHLAYRDRYERAEESLMLFDGVYDLVSALKARGCTVAVATAKSRKGINRSLEKTGLADFVSYSRTPEECKPKPHPQMILEILEESGVVAADAVMVGDTTHDLEMAERAGVAAIGVTYGAHTRQALASIDAVLSDTVSDLAQILI